MGRCLVVSNTSSDGTEPVRLGSGEVDSENILRGMEVVSLLKTLSPSEESRLRAAEGT